MTRKKCSLGQYANAEAGRHSRLYAKDTGTRIGNAPSPIRGFERMDRPLTVYASLLEYRERQGVTAEIDRLGGHCSCRSRF